MTFTTPCSALPPCTAVPGPRNTSMREAASWWAKKSSLILQKPGDVSGMPSSAVSSAPQAPAPVSTGERSAGRYSCPLPRCRFTPGTRTSASCTCVCPGSPPRRSRSSTLRLRPTSCASVARRRAVTTISSIPASAPAVCAAGTAGKSRHWASASSHGRADCRYRREKSSPIRTASGATLSRSATRGARSAVAGFRLRLRRS